MSDNHEIWLSINVGDTVPKHDKDVIAYVETILLSDQQIKASCIPGPCLPNPKLVKRIIACLEAGAVALDGQTGGTKGSKIVPQAVWLSRCDVQPHFTDSTPIMFDINGEGGMLFSGAFHQNPDLCRGFAEALRLLETAVKARR
ncbi:hypothetical protein [Bifidobacterium callitrichidarum]|uniref:Uncharacterized protein n=1 Tax=Bifidobacterium callitrichidarum TaxID=2052941 RepID=A0A2U2MYQ2_9BIFI|nr:hypothetical protein [Bifidobacterium callitrichidarum]PWG62066.1 hypothetical protein DF196_12630 [Bifidobacterium callitrichidarum]